MNEKTKNEAGITYWIIRQRNYWMPDQHLNEFITTLKDDNLVWQLGVREYDNYIYVGLSLGASLEYRLYEDEVVNQTLEEWTTENVQLDGLTRF